MGKLQAGIMNAISGKVGNIVGAVYKGMNIIRKIPSKSSKLPKQSQIDQRAKFTIVLGIITVLDRIVKIGYRSYTGIVSPKNAAVSYNLKNAIIGVSPDFEFDYSEALISKGKLFNGEELELIELADRALKITWTMDNYIQIQDFKDRRTDLCYAVFYSVEKKMYLSIEGTATRESLETNTIIPKLFKGNTLHGYVFFVSADGKSVSNSQYMGAIKVPV